MCLLHDLRLSMLQHAIISSFHYRMITNLFVRDGAGAEIHNENKGEQSKNHG